MSSACKRNERRNAEGYSDPTAYQAIIHIEGLKENTYEIERVQYIRNKIIMLRRDFLVNPTPDEINKLLKIHGESNIDRAVVHIIKKHWEND